MLKVICIKSADKYLKIVTHQKYVLNLGINKILRDLKD